MYSPTYSELKSALQKELDIEDETFITPIELLNYFNEAVDMVEAVIHDIYEDYFLDSAPLDMVSGTSLYNLPSTIFAQKIRRITYDNGADKQYIIKRIKDLADTMGVQSYDWYRYLLINSSTTGMQLKLFPTPNETSSNATIWHIRNAKRFAADADVCDIPEFTPVVVQYVRVKCLEKEGHPDAQTAAGKLEAMKMDMITSLTARVPDEDNFIEKDISFYEDFDNWNNGGFL